MYDIFIITNMSKNIRIRKTNDHKLVEYFQIFWFET